MQPAAQRIKVAFCEACLFFRGEAAFHNVAERDAFLRPVEILQIVARGVLQRLAALAELSVAALSRDAQPCGKGETIKALRLRFGIAHVRVSFGLALRLETPAFAVLVCQRGAADNKRITCLRCRVDAEGRAFHRVVMVAAINPVDLVFCPLHARRHAGLRLLYILRRWHCR